MSLLYKLSVTQWRFVEHQEIVDTHLVLGTKWRMNMVLLSRELIV